MKLRIKNYFAELVLLIRSVPPITLSLFILSVFAMNLLANKSLNIPLDWLALDAGIILSWVAFLSMDVLTKHFGPRAATQISVLAIAINLFACLIFYLASLIPGTWGAFYDYGELPEINRALDGTFGGTWFVVLGSTTAFLVSAIINNFSNWGIGKLLRKRQNGFVAFALRSYLSTAIGQFADNLVFALIVSHLFFEWSLLQCFTCAVTGMLAELLIEMAFSPIGYRVCKSWKDRAVGEQYFEFVRRSRFIPSDSAEVADEQGESVGATDGEV